MPGDPRFHAMLDEMGKLHDKKQEDYGTDSDPFANVRASREFGVAPWIGALIRLNDKVTRLKQFAMKGKLANESARDSMLDIAVYAIITYILYEEEEKSPALTNDPPSHSTMCSATGWIHPEVPECAQVACQPAGGQSGPWSAKELEKISSDHLPRLTKEVLPDDYRTH
jgi:hypothetical protein